MQIDDVARRPDALLYMERYVDEGTRTYSPFAARSEAAPEYRPGSHRASFELVSVRVPQKDVHILQANPRRALLERYVHTDEVLFLVHPETWGAEGIDGLGALSGLPRGERIEVAPTASTRTVLPLGLPASVPAHFLKLHYPRRISRFNRRLRLKNIRTSVEVTADLATLDCERFAYLPDALGIVHGDSANPWGFLVRDATPHPARAGRFLVPFFALYGGDLERPEDRPLLVQLIDRLGVEPASFVVDELMIPIVECWIAAARGRGILLESHAQNVLLEIDADLRPRRIVHRDFDVWIDAGVREREGLAAFTGSHIEADTGHGREPHYSLVYDHFVGRELLDYLLATLARFFTADEDEVHERIAAAFHRSFPDASEIFPRSTTFYFSNELLPGNDFRLEPTGRPPVWR